MGAAFVGVTFIGVACAGAASAADGDSRSTPALPASCTRRTFEGGGLSPSPLSPGISERVSAANPPDRGFDKYRTKHAFLASSLPSFAKALYLINSVSGHQFSSCRRYALNEHSTKA